VADAAECGSQSEAARRHGVSQSGLGYWVRKLATEKTRTAEPQLLPVRVTTAVAPSRRFGLIIDDLRLEFDEGAEPAYIAAVARALRAC
jgi:transposase-like protein